MFVFFKIFKDLGTGTATKQANRALGCHILAHDQEPHPSLFFYLYSENNNNNYISHNIRTK